MGPQGTGFAGEEMTPCVGTLADRRPRRCFCVTLKTDDCVGEDRSTQESPQRSQAHTPVPCVLSSGPGCQVSRAVCSRPRCAAKKLSISWCSEVGK